MSLAELELPTSHASDNDLPEGWISTKIGKVFSVNPPKPPLSRLPKEAPVTFVPMHSVDAEKGAISAPIQRPFGEVRSSFTSFAENDVILAKITPCMENGKAAVARGLINGLGFGSTEFHVFRATGAALPEFLYHYVRQEAFRTEAEKEMTGSVGQRRVPAEFLRGAELPLPPLAEQRRIVAKLEQVLAAARASRERLARVPALMKRFRQSVFAAACAGRLTADWREQNPTVEPASRLLERILAERRARWEAEQVAKKRGKAPSLGLDVARTLTAQEKAKYQKPAAPDTSELLELPEEWCLASLDALTTRITSGSRDWKRYYGSGDSTFVMAQNVRPSYLDLTHRQPINPPRGDSDCERSLIASGDLLVTIVGANTGDACPVLSDLMEHYVCQSVALIRPISNELTAFLNLFLNSAQHGRGQFDAFNYGAGRPHLSFDQLRNTRVALPSLAEQQEIVRRVETLFKFADAVERRTAAAAARADKLTQAVLAKAFRGELVPTEAELARAEGRDYEPASALLGRLRAEREQAAARRSPGGRQGAWAF